MLSYDCVRGDDLNMARKNKESSVWHNPPGTHECPDGEWVPANRFKDLRDSHTQKGKRVLQVPKAEELHGVLANLATPNFDILGIGQPGVLKIIFCPKLDPLHLKLLDRLAASWQSDPRILGASDPRVIQNHPAFRAFIDAGVKVVPYILKRYQNENAAWALALREILGFSPVKPEHRGKADLVREDWLNWGTQNGLL